MNSIRIIHAADLHLDSAFEALGAAGAAQRRSEQRQLLQRIFELTQEKQADILLLAGDVFDSSEFVYSETAHYLKSLIASCSAHVFVAPGNHDFYSARSLWAQGGFGDRLHVFKSTKVQCVELPELGARVYGAAFTDFCAPALLRDFHAPRIGETVNIGIFHGDTRSPDSRYSPISTEDIADSGLDYLALGHVHERSALSRSGETRWAYPGCAEGRGFDECGEKGVYYVELSCGECEAEFIPVCRRQYHILELDAAGDIAAQLPTDTQDDIYRLILRGECAAAPDIKAISAELSGRFFALDIRDATRPARDLWEGADGDGLRGLFLRKMKAKYDAADEAARHQIINATRWGLAALDGGEAVESI